MVSAFRSYVRGPGCGNASTLSGVSGRPRKDIAMEDILKQRKRKQRMNVWWLVIVITRVYICSISVSRVRYLRLLVVKDSRCLCPSTTAMLGHWINLVFEFSLKSNSMFFSLHETGTQNSVAVKGTCGVFLRFSLFLTLHLKSYPLADRTTHKNDLYLPQLTLPTDKNKTVSVHHILNPERFDLQLATFLVSKYAHKSFVTELRWTRICIKKGEYDDKPVDESNGHPHSFIRDGNDERMVKVEVLL